MSKEFIARLKKAFRMLYPKYHYEGLINRHDLKKLEKSENFNKGEIFFAGNKLQYSDKTGFLHSVDEIFCGNIYSFKTGNPSPIIFDCGANIGLSIIYFKKLYPLAKITAFEPDPAIFSTLEYNVRSFGFNDVKLINAAVWKKETKLSFFSEGSLAGSSELDFSGAGNLQSVQAIRLKDILATGKEIDFLKIDIEGAENEVLFDIADELKNVRKVFIEYHSIAGNPQKLGGILQLISNAGFRYFIKEAVAINGAPFLRKVKKGFDLQLNIFCTK